MPWKTPSTHTASPGARLNAPRLRRNPTEAEKMLWKLLRSEVEVLGTHFRRQVAIGPYVADFVCLGEKLILEVDGEAHATAANYDMKRDDYLSGRVFGC